ncbi:MAG: glycosyl hydrolase [Candidatus Aminicenantes bacterium]|nr:glycosyl hydrolase [Candidatus Aminicenantes bacterium]
MKKLLLIAMLALCIVACAAREEDVLANGFVRPPDSARPWVYWFWLNSNITREGITADLEAMKRVGIGGVLIMEVDQGAPVGPAAFMGPQWRELFKHAVAEAGRLGLEVNMNDDAGWNGSGGPWIKPEQSMQKVVWTETALAGPRRFDGQLAQPEADRGFYRDIAVLAFPTPGDYRIADIKSKALYERRDVAAAAETKLPAGMTIAPARITYLTEKMGPDGHLAWDVPPGKWTILRFGHTGTGVENAPAPASGRGLECDKLSKEGIEAQFAGMMAKLIADVGPAAGKSLVATHIDSWENGAQNWTARMREEFLKRRGYDPLTYLPAITGRVVDTLEISERFLWDLRQTVNDLLLENYAGHMATLARQNGLRLSIEAYGGPSDDITYGGRADEPMGEFWIGGGAFETLKQMASSAHIYGRPILGAEAFTANDRERWQQHPALIKALGDRAFCEGVNRFVFHRYAMQPWLDYRPGMTMGPWGLHYERTSTWWELAGPWHEYLARCQYLLRQGTFVADIFYLQPEASPQEFQGHDRSGYDYDNGTPEALLTRMSVEDGRIVLPDGMSYRVLVLPDTTRMTPALLRKVQELAAAGATIIGPTKPTKAPGLSDYPNCDTEVTWLAGELWGQGKIVTDKSPEQVLAGLGVAQDFSAPPFVRWIHRKTGGTEIYFVASNSPQAREVTCTFRVTGLRPEFWRPETGEIEPVPVYEQNGGTTRIPIPFGPSGSVFVVFRQGAGTFDPVVSVTLDDRTIEPAPELEGNVRIEKAVYGVPGDPKRSRDVGAKLQAIADGGETSFQVSRLAGGDDPAYGVVKTLEAEYTAGGKTFKVSGKDPDTINFPVTPGIEPMAEVHYGENGRLLVEARQAGRFELKTASGRSLQAEAPVLPPPQELTGPWELRFPPNWGAPERVALDKLVSWSEHGDPGVKYFSGTGTYTKTITVPREMIGKDRRVYLDLGKVQVMATVKLNGKDLGVLWKPPYRVDVTGTLKAGDNTLEIGVANLWINRMIGDEELPEDSDRNPDGTLKAWPRWVQEGKPSPTGRFTFTSWRLWKRGEAPVESGLLGPVTVRVTAVARVGT